MVTQAPNTALVIKVPEFESVISSARWEHDPSAKNGMPAHITILIPFVLPNLLDDKTKKIVESVIRSHAAFTFAFQQVCQFPGVVYFAPEPVTPFIELTKTIWAKFPGHPPYGGKVAAIVPHMTIGLAENTEGQLQLTQYANKLLANNTSKICEAFEVTLMENLTGQWRETAIFSLRAP